MVTRAFSYISVSYTHLDVYKRQFLNCLALANELPPNFTTFFILSVSLASNFALLIS